MWETIKYAVGAAFEALGIIRQRSADKNSPDMKANAAAKTDAQISDKIAAADAKAEAGDLSEVEKQAAE